MKNDNPLFGFEAAMIVLVILVALLSVIFVGITRSTRVAPTPVPTMTPLPARTLAPSATPARIYDAPPTYTPLPKVTLALPTATPTVDIAMTEIAKGAANGILVLPIGAETALPVGATPLPRFTLSPDAFPVCNPNYARVCLPANLDRAFCYDLVERNILVIGTDSLHIDANANGIACEDGE